MKIAIFCPNYPPAALEGGISHYSQILAHNLSKLGQNIIIVTGNEYLGEASDGPVSVLKLAGKWDQSNLTSLIAELRSQSVEMVNIQYSPVMYPLNFKLGWRRVLSTFPSTISFHTLWGGSILNHVIALWLVAASDGVIATNSEIVYLLRRYLPFAIKKTRSIPIGSNIEPRDTTDDLGKVIAKYVPDQDKALLVYFGMVYPGKGMDLLFDTAQILWTQYKLDFRLLVIGGGISDLPEYLKEKKKFILELGLEDKVIWTGRIPAADVSALLSCSTLIILPYEAGVSDRRGTLMASLAHKKAIVTTRPAVPVPLFRNNENMIWPASNDAHSIAKTVFKVLQDHQLRRRLEMGAAELARHFEWEAISKNTRDFFYEIFQRTRNRGTV